MKSTNRTGQPTLQTYWEIIQGIGKTFFNLGDCEVWAQPPWLTVTITYLSIFFIFLYFYVLIFGLVKARSRLSPIFLRSILILAVGDLTVLFCSMRDCVLGLKPARHMAWQTLGTFAVEIIVGANFVLSLSRTISIFGKEKIARKCSLLLSILVVFWSLSLSIMNHFSLVDIVYFQKDIYNDYFAFPFNFIRMPILFSEVGLTAFFYILSALVIRRMLRAYNRRIFRSEMKVFAISILIFFIELEFIYSTFWLGDFVNVGTAEFNANLDYTSRPFATGLTPVFSPVYL